MVVMLEVQTIGGSRVMSGLVHWWFGWLGLLEVVVVVVVAVKGPSGHSRPLHSPYCCVVSC